MTRGAYELTILHGIPDPDENVDVEVRFEDGARYAATFATIANLAVLLDRYEATGECLGGTYIWMADLIVVRCLDLPTIAATVADLIEQKEFTASFRHLVD